jgi:L-iditol 2-dehydrogenase
VKVARSVTLEEVRLEEVADPVPGAGEVVCDVLACGVCASDVTDWYVRAKLPAVLGHEPAGLVTAVGEGVRTVSVGDRVAIHHHAPCGECRRCRRGHETLCERFRSTSFEPGGFAERVRVPVELVDELLVLPDELDANNATLIEPLACVMRAQDRASLRAGDSLLVVGAGCNGLLHIAAAHARGVEVVWVREPRPERLALAEGWGAEHHGNELVDVAMVCTPNPDAIAAASEAIAPGGTLCLYAPPAPGAPLPVDGTSLFMRELGVTASYSAGPGDMRGALHAIVDGSVDTAALITHRLALEETALALSLQRRGEALKAVVVPNGNGAEPGR